MQLKRDSQCITPLCRKQFNYGHDKVFGVISIETPSVSPGHTKIIPAHIPQWNWTPIQVFILFESKDKFEPNNKVSEPSNFFNFTEEVIPIAIENKTEEEITIYRNATPVFSENVPGA